MAPHEDERRSGRSGRDRSKSRSRSRSRSRSGRGGSGRRDSGRADSGRGSSGRGSSGRASTGRSSAASASGQRGDTEKLFDVEWLQNCYGKVGVPNERCENFLALINAKLTPKIRGDLDNDVRQQCLFILLGKERHS